MNEMHLRPAPVVTRAHFQRLLGFPPGYQPDPAEAGREQWVRDWFHRHGHPWLYWRVFDALEFEEDQLCLEGLRIEHGPLVRQWRQAGCTAAALLVACAGGEAEAAAAEHWKQEEPDQYYYLEIFASAVAEQLVQTGWLWLCNYGRTRQLNVLPPVSPGYANWRPEVQAPLIRHLRNLSSDYLTPRIDVLDSGMLRPKKSQFALFGLTPHPIAQFPGVEVPCRRCGKIDCTFRRDAHTELPGDSPAPCTATPYAFHLKTLRRWAAERLTLHERPDGAVQAVFRYEGSTCSNLGWPLAIEFELLLRSGGGEYHIESAQCRPAAGDEGHRKMCAYLDGGEAFLAGVMQEHPGVGMTLEQALAWDPPLAPSGCLCQPQNRLHKWRIVLQTLHFAFQQPAALHPVLA